MTEPKKDSLSNWRNSRAAAESRLRCVCDEAPCNSNLEKGGTAALADYLAVALQLKEMHENVYTHESQMELWSLEGLHCGTRKF